MPSPTTFKIFVPMLKTSIGGDGKKRLHGVASSTIKDRHGDTMALSALSDMESSARQNMTIFLNHSYNVPEDVAGTVESAFVRSSMQDPDIHDLSLDIVVNEANDRAVKAWEAINGGTKLGLSIGAMIPEGGAKRNRESGAYDIAHVELLETSLVGVPANPRSWVEYAVKALTTGEPNGTSTRLVNGKLLVTDLKSDFPDDDEELCPKCNSGRRRRSKDCDNDEFHTVEEKAFELETPDGDMPEFEGGDDEDAPTIGEEAAVETDAPAEVPDSVVPDVEVGFAGLADTTQPDTTNATVTVETPLANITVDTGNRGKSPGDGASQEAQSSVPENEDEDEAIDVTNPWAAIGLSGESEVDLATALQSLEPSVVASLTTSKELLAAMTRELIDTKAALKAVTKERDLACEMAEKAIKGTGVILDRLSSTPVGRRAVVREARAELSGISAVYSEEFVTLLRKDT